MTVQAPWRSRVILRGMILTVVACLSLAGPAFAQTCPNADANNVGMGGGGLAPTLTVYSGSYRLGIYNMIRAEERLMGSPLTRAYCDNKDNGPWCYKDEGRISLTGTFAQSSMQYVAHFYGWWTAAANHYSKDYSTSPWVLFCQNQYSQNFGPQPSNCSGLCYYTPILVPTGPSANVQLSSREDGVRFDLNGDGSPELVAWPVGDAAWLAVDLDGDGEITSGKELFGSVSGGGHYPTGFEALKTFFFPNPNEGAGAVSPLDKGFDRLLLWHDRNRDGVSQSDELTPASSVLSAIGLGYIGTNRTDQFGNQYTHKGWAERVFGSGGQIPLWDVTPAQ